MTGLFPRLLRAAGRLIRDGMVALSVSNPLYVGPVPPPPDPDHEPAPGPADLHRPPHTHPDHTVRLTPAEHRHWSELRARALHDRPAGAS
jgi:hypothetical protein